MRLIRNYRRFQRCYTLWNDWMIVLLTVREMVFYDVWFVFCEFRFLLPRRTRLATCIKHIKSSSLLNFFFTDILANGSD